MQAATPGMWSVSILRRKNSSRPVRVPWRGAAPAQRAAPASARNFLRPIVTISPMTANPLARCGTIYHRLWTFTEQGVVRSFTKDSCPEPYTHLDCFVGAARGSEPRAVTFTASIRGILLTQLLPHPVLSIVGRVSDL